MIILLIHSTKKKKADQAGNDSTKNVEIMVPLKYLIFRETLKCH